MPEVTAPFGEANSPFSSTAAEVDAWSTAALVFIKLTTVPLGLSFATGCWRLSTSCTVPRIEAPQPHRAATATTASAVLSVMISLPLTAPQVNSAPAAESAANVADHLIAPSHVARKRRLRYDLAQ